MISQRGWGGFGCPLKLPNTVYFITQYRDKNIHITAINGITEILKDPLSTLYSPVTGMSETFVLWHTLWVHLTGSQVDAKPQALMNC